MKILRIAAKWLFILCLPILLLSASIAGAVNCLWLYKYGFDKYDVGQTTGLADAELEKAARGLISYFNSDEEPISVTVVKDGEPFGLFNQREIAHLADVKGLIRLDYWMLLGASVYVLGYSGLSLFFRKPGYRHRLATGVVASSTASPKASLFGRQVELDGAIHNTMVGYGQGRHAQFPAPGHQLGNARHAVKQTVLSMNMEVIEHGPPQP